MKIGALVTATGIAPATIRFYESAGLLPAPARTEGNYRDYAEADLERLRFVGRCRSLGMELDEIRALLELRAGDVGDCAGVNALLDAHLGHVRARIRELRQLETQLAALRERCREVAGTERCGILQELANGREPVERPTARLRNVHR